jgi:hypothetical protein
MNPYVIQALAEERQRDACRQAAKARLVALARCCKPSKTAQLIAALRSHISTPDAVCC